MGSIAPALRSAKLACYVRRRNRMWVTMKKRGPLLAIALLVLLMIVFGCLAGVYWQEVADSSRLTPALVLMAFQEAGFECSDVGPMDYCGGPLACGDQNVQFMLGQGEQKIRVRVIQYGSTEEAAHYAGVVNDLNWRMHGSFVCAFRRGSTVLAVSPCVEEVASELETTFRSMRVSEGDQ